MTAPKIQILPLRRASPSSSSSDDSPPKDSTEQDITKKTRTSKPKVRSGCVTCKIRRVKCDETKPECERCTSTGRKCDGYVVVPRKKRSDHAPTRGPSLCTEVISPAELRSLGFFHHKTAPGLSSYFDADFWTRLVFQMSYVEPSIRHAMVALGALHEQQEENMTLAPRLPPPIDPTADPVSFKKPYQLAGRAEGPKYDFAIKQYNEAIGHLSRRINGESSVEITLLACILFVCVEFLRGDSKDAVSHFRGGMKIALASLSEDSSSTATATLDLIKEHLLPFFNRIELLSNLFGNEANWDYHVDLLDAVPDEFRTLRDARDSIVDLGNLTVRFIKGVRGKKYARNVSTEEFARQAVLLSQLSVWASTFDKLLLSEGITPRELDAAKTLRIHQMVATIWLRRCTIPEECGNDPSIPDFETVVSLAESIQSVAGTYEQRVVLHSSSFLFDMEVVSPLHFVTTKCRHPLIRRRAIAILKTSQRREGLWDSDMAAAMAQRILQIEEANLTVLDGSELPAERDRIHNAQIESDVGTNPKTHRVTFHTKPNGIDGPFKSWKEQIVLT